jgi:hypothetical protein
MESENDFEYYELISDGWYVAAWAIILSTLITLFSWSFVGCSLAKHKTPCEAYWTGNPKNQNKK